MSLSRRLLRISFLLPIVITIALALLAFGCFENPWYQIDLFTGNSMRPVLNPDDLVITIHQRSGTLEPGMIIGYINPIDGVHVIHRIVATEGDCYITKGTTIQILTNIKCTR